MPLIACPDCEKQVSSSATSCVHCGCPVASILYDRQRQLRRQQEKAYFQNLLRFAPDIERYILSTLLSWISNLKQSKQFHPTLLTTEFQWQIRIHQIPHLSCVFDNASAYSPDSEVKQVFDAVLPRIQQELKRRYPRGKITYGYCYFQYYKDDSIVHFSFSGDRFAFM